MGRPAEKLVRESEARFSSIFTHSPIGIEIFDGYGRLTEANGACLHILGARSIDDIQAYNLFASPGVTKEVKRRVQCGETVKYQVSFDFDSFKRQKIYSSSRSGHVYFDIVVTPLCIGADMPPLRYLLQVRDVTEYKLAEQALRDLSARSVELQEAERRHIACELHDEIGQSLTGVKLLIEMASRSCGGDAASHLDQAQSLLDEIMARLEDMSLNLRPAMLDDLGLLPTLEWHFRRYTAQTGVHVTFTACRIQERLPTEIETAAYRIIQECLTNVARHARAQKVTVRLCARRGKSLIIQVRDRGTGFDPDQMWGARVPSGLIGMRERALGLGGRLELRSTLGKGTAVVAELPYSVTV